MKKRNYMLLTALPLMGALTFGVSAYAQSTTTTDQKGSRPSKIHHMKMKGSDTKHLEDMALVLGMNQTDLKTMLDSGKTIDSILTDKGMTKEAFHEKMKAAHESSMKKKLAEDVASGKITQAKADEIIKEHAQREVEMKEKMAKVLGITVSELDAYKASNTPLETIIAQKGLDKETVMKSLRPEGKEMRGFGKKN
jgi:hypothetical protein